MDRRTFLSALGLLAAPLGAGAQTEKIHRLGRLWLGAPTSDRNYLVDALRELGYVEGRGCGSSSAHPRGGPLSAA